MMHLTFKVIATFLLIKAASALNCAADPDCASLFCKSTLFRCEATWCDTTSGTCVPPICVVRGTPCPVRVSP